MKKVIFYFTFITINIFSLESKSENIKSQEIQKIFGTNLYKIYLKPKSGLINSQGKIILETDYDEIKQLFFIEQCQKITKSGVYDGLYDKKTPIDFFLIRLNDKYGVIDKYGKIILEPKYSYIYNVIKAENKYFFPFNEDEKSGLVDENGKVVLKPIYDNISRVFPNENYPDLISFSKNGMIGVMNNRGKIILDPIYEDINGFQSKNSNSFFITLKGLNGIANKNGKILVKPQFDAFSVLSNENKAFVKINNKWGAINEDGNFIISAIYDALSNNYSKRNFFYNKDGKWGIINKNGTILIEAKFDSLGYPFNYSNINYCLKEKSDKNLDNTYIPFSINKKWGFIDENGNVLIEAKFDYIYNFHNGLGYVSIKKENIDKEKSYKRPTYSYYDGNYHSDKSDYHKWGVIDKKGNWLIKPEFDFIYEFSEGLAYVNKEGKFGYININGDWVIKPQFEQKSSLDEVCPTYFENGFAEVFKDKKLNLIDKTGNIYLKYNYGFNSAFESDFYPEKISENKLKQVDFKNISNLTFSTVGSINKIESFYEVFNQQKNNDNLDKNKIIVNYGQWYGLVDKNLKFVLKPEYSYILPDLYHKNYLMIKLNSKKGIVDYNGNFILKPIYSEIKNEQNKFFYLNFNNKYGFTDDNYKIIVEPKFDEIHPFSEGLAGVSIDNRFGFIDEKGKFVLKPSFDDVKNFSNNLAWFSEGNTWGLIDKTGKIIKKPTFSEVDDFNNNIATFKKDSKILLLNKKGQRIITEEIDDINEYKEGLTKENLVIKKEGFYYLINKNGKYISNKKFQYIFHNGIVKIDNKWGLIDNNANFIIKPKYEKIEPCRDKFIVISNRKYGIIDKKENWIAKPQYDYIYVDNNDINLEIRDNEFIIDKNWKIINSASSEKYYNLFNGFYLVKKNKKYGIFNIKKKKIIDIKYDSITTVSILKDNKKNNQGNYSKNDYNYLFKVILNNKMGYFSDKGIEIIPAIIDSERKLNDDFTIITINHKEGLINNKFKTIIEAKYDDIRFTESYNGLYEKTDLAKIKLEDKYGFIDENGKVILEPKYDLIFKFINKIAIVKKIDKFGFINSEGKELLDPIYDEIYDFKNGFFLIRSNEKAGLVNKEGKIIIEPNKYEAIRPFEDNLISASLYGKWGIIDIQGKVLIDFKYDEFYSDSFKNDLTAFRYNDKWGFINKNGVEVIKPIFDGVREFNDGLAGVLINEKWGFIDTKGNLVIDPKYDEVADFSEGVIATKIGKKWGAIDKNGKLLLDYVYDFLSPFKNGKARASIGSKFFDIDKTGKELRDI